MHATCETWYTLPGELARRLYLRYGCHRTPAIECWTIKDDKPVRVTVVGLRSATGCGERADYADLAGGGSCATFYLWPVSRHCRPALVRLLDEYGPCQQWCAAVRANVRQRWDWRIQ